MPMSASEFADRLVGQRRPGWVKDLQEGIEACLEDALAKDQSWCTISLHHSPLPDDVVLEAAAAFPEWKCEITDGSPDGRQLHLTIPDHIRRAKGLG